MQVVGDNDLDYYPHQFVLPDGRVLIAGPRIDDTYFVNPAANFAFTDAPDLKVDRVFGFGAGVLLPGPPSGSTKCPADRRRGHRPTPRGRPPPRSSSTRPTRAPAGSSGAAAREPPQRERGDPPGREHPRGGRQPGRGEQRLPQGDAALQPAANAWTPMADQGEGRGTTRPPCCSRTRAWCRPAATPTPCRGIVNDIAEIFAAVPVPRLRPGDRLGAGLGRLRRPVRHRGGRPGEPRRADGARRDHPRQRHEPAPRGAGPLAGRRRCPGGLPPSPNVAPPGPYCSSCSTPRASPRRRAGSGWACPCRRVLGRRGRRRRSAAPRGGRPGAGRAAPGGSRRQG